MVVKKNLRHFRNIIKLCNAHGIVLINAVTAYGYNDIFYEKGFSEYLNQMLRKMGQRNIVKLKDIYHSHREIYSYISGRGHQFHHFSHKAAQLIADHLDNYLTGRRFNHHANAN